MAEQTLSFGRVIAEARKSKNLSQKDLASKIRVEDAPVSKPISPQYLNDIEHDRRSPSSSHLVNQFASELNLEAEFLSFLAGRWPDEMREEVKSQDQFKVAFSAFRSAIGKG